MTINRTEQIELYCYLMELAAKTDEIAQTRSESFLQALHRKRAAMIREYANEFYYRE